MSRKAHEPTPELRQLARSLAARGLPQEDIAKLVGNSPKTLRAYYRAELDEGTADANAAVIGFLLESIRRGKVPAMIFFEKCRGGKHETIREEITGLGGGPIGVVAALLPCAVGRLCGRYPHEYESGDELIGPPAGFSDEGRNPITIALLKSIEANSDEEDDAQT